MFTPPDRGFGELASYTTELPYLCSYIYNLLTVRKSISLSLMLSPLDGLPQQALTHFVLFIVHYLWALVSLL